MSRFHHLNRPALFTLLAIGAAASVQAAGECPAPPSLPVRPAVDQALKPGEVYLAADAVDSIEGGIARLRGNAEITRDAQQLRAESIDYDEAGERIEIRGTVDYWDDDIYLHGQSAQVDLADKSAGLSDAAYRVLSNGGHGRAGEIHVLVDKLSEARDVDYTTCEAAGPERKDEFWKLSAETITLNHETKWGAGRNVVLKIKDIPVLYTPYLSFPLDNERKTGFLTPSFGNTRRNGLEVQAPFYWNIAPNMDATLTPRLLADSGLMMMGEFRYLTDNSHGWINAEYLPSDGNYNDEDRSFISLEHEQALPWNGKLHVVFNNLSDQRYLEDFGPSLEITSLSAVDRFAELAFAGENWNAYARVQDFQETNRLNLGAVEPYKRLPQIRYRYTGPGGNHAFNYGLDGELVYFDYSDRYFPCPGLVCLVAVPAVEGLRFDLNPFLTYPVYTAASFIEPKIGVRYTQYNLNDESWFIDKSPDRFLPYASLDGGLFLDRDVMLFGERHTQTLEPRFYYLYTPEEDQDDLPVFDTGLYDDSFDTLFYENRYSGADRVNDANRVTLALTSRLVNRQGRELGRLSLGQIFYLDAQEVALPGQVIQDEDLSPLVFELAASPAADWSFTADWQWEPDAGRLQKLVLQARYRSEAGRVLNIAYRTRQARLGAIRTDAIDVEQTDVSLRWPLTSEWSVVGRWIYALENDKSLDIFGGLEYDSCCWGLRLVGRRFVSSAEGDVQTGIFLQFELKGLAGIGQKTVDFLHQNIPGYENEF
jgi:LPS-assembly protein